MPENDTAKKNDGEAEVLEAIAAMPEPDRGYAEKLHAIIMKNGPMLVPRTWYGMPAYSLHGKVCCYFRSTKKFGERYMTFGFNDVAHVDDGAFWPIVWALTSLGEAEEARVVELIKKAVS